MHVHHLQHGDRLCCWTHNLQPVEPPQEVNTTGQQFLTPIELMLPNIFRVIQSSHPVCNTIMLVGVIVCLASVFLLGLDGRFVSSETYPNICQARAWLLTIGFTLSYGAMFSKVWRVHRLTTKAKSDPKVRMVSWSKAPGWILKLLEVDQIS